jgi:hypothetical protein
MNKRVNVVCIYATKDEIYLKDLVESLPKEFGVILCNTIQSVEDKVELVFEDVNSNTKIYKLFYTGDFKFNVIRNRALDLSLDCDLILSIDADERLLIHQHKDLIKAINDISEREDYENFGGLFFHNLSTFLHKRDNYGFYERALVPQIKLFKSELRYIKNIHENLDLKDKFVIESPFIIHHVGYEISENEMLSKLERNHRIALLELSENVNKNMVNETKREIENIKNRLLKTKHKDVIINTAKILNSKINQLNNTGVLQ